jgi:ribonuclease P/MRP protein subunit RPP1
MPEFHDFFVSENLRDDAEELGWSEESQNGSVKVLEADDWGELKRKIDSAREDYDVLAFRGGDHELNRKAFSESRMDVVLHPGKDRKDSGMNHVDAKKAAENDVAIGFPLKEVPDNPKRQSQELTKWRRNLKLCEKYGTQYLITTEARKLSELRAPRDLAAVISSLGYDGKKAVSEFPGKILEKNIKAGSDSQFRPGHEVVE